MRVYMDIGTSKVAAIALDERDVKKVLGFSKKPCEGLSRGVVADMDKTQQACTGVLSDLQKQTKSKIDRVSVNVSGDHLSAVPSSGVVGVQAKEVSQFDVDRVLEAARAVSITSSNEVLHVLPLEYVVDGQRGVQRPLGMTGVRLEVHVLLITCVSSALQNVLKCIERSGVEVLHVVVSHLASGHAVLSNDEKALGVCMVDIGAGTTDVSVYGKGVLRDLFVVPIAGSHVTSDLSIALRTAPRSAEKLKLQHAQITEDVGVLDEVLEVSGVVDAKHARVVKKQVVAEVVQARYYEIFNCVAKILRKRNLLSAVPAGLVLTGGGAKLPGLVPFLSALFQVPVRVGWPTTENEDGEDESMSTLMGLHQVVMEGSFVVEPDTGMWSKLTRFVESYL